MFLTGRRRWLNVGSGGGGGATFLASWVDNNQIWNIGSNAMRRNVAGQYIGCQLVSKTDGTPVTTGTTTVYVLVNAGTQAAGSVGSGACTHEGNGFYSYAPAQEETNGTHIAFTFVNTNAVNATVQVYPINYGTSGEMTSVVLGATQTGVTIPTVTTVTTATNVTNDYAKYMHGAVWINTVSGAAGTVSFTNGIMSNPCSTLASAKTIGDNLKLKKYWIQAGSAITLAAAYVGYMFDGFGYSLALGGQDISSAQFQHVENLTGTGTCATGEAICYHCHLGTITIGEADFNYCHLQGTITMAQASVPYYFNSCTGIAAAKITFAAAGQTGVVAKWSGALTIAGMVAGNTLWIDGDGDITLDATNTGGTVYINGAIRLTNSGSGQTIVDTSRWSEDQTIAVATNLTNLPAIPTDWLTATGVKADAVTKIQTGLATPTNITAGTITTVTNLTNAPTNGDLTATMKSSVTTAATAATPTATAVTGAVGSVTGLTATDIGAIKTTIGIAGAGLTALGDTRLANLDATVSSRSTYAGGAVASVTAGVTVTTNNDKTGYALSVTPPTATTIADAVWDEAIAGHTGAGTTGNALSTASSGGVDPAVLADAIWDEALTGHSTAGTAGKKLTDLANADLSAVATAANLAIVDGIVDSILVDTTAIKAKTNNIPASPSAVGDAMTLTSAYDSAKTAATQASINSLWTTAITESYAADGSAATPAQAMYMILQLLAEKSLSGTTMTVKKLDGSTTAMTFTLNDGTTPTSITRAS